MEIITVTEKGKIQEINRAALEMENQNTKAT